MTAYLLCGPSLSGKSAAAARLSRALGATVVSADSINQERGLPFGAEGLPESEWAETFRILLDRVRAGLRRGTDVVVDDTLCYRWLRDHLRSECEACGARVVLLVLSPPAEDLLRRFEALRSAGEREVLTPQRMSDHLARFERPDSGEAPIDITHDRALETFIASERVRVAPARGTDGPGTP